jgi:hypothetical protein
MAGSERRRTILEAYERTRREVAENQVVDAAEDIVGNALVEHLDAVRREATDLVAVAAESRRAALRLVRAAQVDGDPRHISCAHALLEHSERDLQLNLAEGRQTLASVQTRLNALSRAAGERAHRRRADLGRLRAAETAVFKDGPGHAVTDITGHVTGHIKDR